MKKVLITGGTGVVGSATLPFFLKDENYEIWLLIRAQTQEHLLSRGQELLKKIGLDTESNSAKERIHFIKGDVSEEGLGLDSKAQTELCTGLTNIIHSAASVSLDMPMDLSLKQSVGAVAQMLALQKKAPHAKLEYVSTVGVKGKNPAPLEEVRIKESHGFFNTYEAGKAEAERIVYQAMDQGQAITIHRPSMVVGHSKSGQIMHFQVFYFLVKLLSGWATQGHLPKLNDIQIDTIPSDFVGEMLYAASQTESTKGQILHACSGPEKSLKVSQLRALFREALLARGIPLPALHFWPTQFFSMLSLLSYIPLLNPKLKKQAGLMPQFLDYASHKQIFLNEQTKKMRFKNQLSPWPEPLEYIKPVMEYYLSAVLR